MCTIGFKIKLLPICFAIGLLFSVTASNAQDLEPKAYTNIPVGLNFILGGYGYSQGGILFDPSVPLENADIKIHGSYLLMQSR